MKTKLKYRISNVVLQISIILSFIFGVVNTFSQEITHNNHESDCSYFYPTDMLFERIGHKEICNEFFVVVYDQTINGVRFTSEIIQTHRELMNHPTYFRKDPRLQIEHSPYSYTSDDYDRGHMVPASNAPNRKGLQETYLMSNIAPQHPHLNRGRWRTLEKRIRTLALKSDQPVRVVTIAHYEQHIKHLENIAIPKGFEKRVYTNPMVCYYAENKQYSIIEERSCK